MKNRHTLLKILFPVVLLLFGAGIGRAQTSDEFMQMLLEQSKIEAAEVLANNPNLRTVEVDVKDGILIYDYLFKEGQFNQPKSQDDIDIMKNSMIRILKANFDSFMEEEVSEEDDFSMEELFEYLKGFRFVYIEENTLKGYQIDISSEEILHYSKPIVNAMDELTTEKFMEQYDVESFAHMVAKSSREECPMVSNGMVVDSMVYDYTNLHFYCRMDSLNPIQSDIATMKKGIRDQMVFANGESNFFTILARLNGGWLLHFTITNIDSSFIISFSPEEIKEIGGDSTLNETERARYALHSVIETTNAQLPKMLDFMTRMDSMYIEGDNLVYQYSILDDFKEVKENQGAVEWIVRSQLMSKDPSVTYLMTMCANAGYGLCHRYMPLATDTDKKKSKKLKKPEVIQFCFSVEELKSYVKK